MTDQQSFTVAAYIRLIEASRRLIKQNGREPTIDEIAAEMDVPADEVREMLRHADRVVTGPESVRVEERVTTDVGELILRLRSQLSSLPDQETGWEIEGLRPTGKEELDKFTPRARKAMVLAVEEASELGHNFVGTEHLLLGLLREGTGIAAQVLGDLDLSLDGVRRLVASMTAEGDAPRAKGERQLTRRAKKAISLALDEARRMNQRYLGTEHLLLGLVREGDGIAAGILQATGIADLEEMRRRVVRFITSGRRPPESPGSKSNVVTCRIDDHDLSAIDALVEAGIRTTRSDAASWLIRAGIEAHCALFDRVNATVQEIRQLRLEAQALAQQLSLEGTAADREAAE